MERNLEKFLKKLENNGESKQRKIEVCRKIRWKDISDLLTKRNLRERE